MSINIGYRQLVLSHKVNGQWAVRIIGKPLPADRAALLALRVSRLFSGHIRGDERRAAELLYRQEATCGRLTVRVAGDGYLSAEQSPTPLPVYSKACPVFFGKKEDVPCTST